MPDKDSRPGGMLEIPDSLGRDLDKAAEGKIPAPPIEAFLSDDALQQIENDTRAADAPVRAENLIPIHPAAAAEMRRQDGGSLPKMPAMRRVIPKPFQRPRITGGSHGKSWRYVRADQVRTDDIVPEIGRVTATLSKLVYAPRDEALSGKPWSRTSLTGGEDMVAIGEVIWITGAGGVAKVKRPEDEVRVFR